MAGFSIWMFCDKITVPKLLAIRNRRLGLLFRVLQIGAIVLICLMVFVSRSWNTQIVPVQYGLAFWATDGDSAARENGAVKHCTDVGSYAYDYAANDRYAPTECKLLSRGESFQKTGSTIFIPMNIKDTYTTELPVDQCANLNCPAPGVKRQTSVQCLCEQKSEFFAKNPETTVLYLNHGFEVPKVNAFGRKYELPEKGQSTVDKGNDENILTVITQDGDDSKRCELNGKSEWNTKEAQNGISAPVADWLKCSGKSLDDLAPNAKSGQEGYSAAPTVRIVGVTLQITLFYKNMYQRKVDYDGPVCYVRISALPVWNSMNAVQFTQIPHAGSPGSTYRYRYSFGITVSVQATGTFHWFDLNELILTITSSLVLIAIPGIIVQIIALNLAGRISKIYNAVAVEKFSIVDRFGGLCARLMGYATNFKELTKETGGEELDADTLDRKLREVFEDQMKEGRDENGNTIDAVLSEAEVKNMSQFLMNQLDPDPDKKEKKVCMVEYLRACNSQEAIKIGDLAAFFDDQRQKTCLESIFGDESRAISQAQSEMRQRSVAKPGQVHPEDAPLAES